MGLLDSLRDAAQNAGLGEVAEGINAVESVQHAVMPQELLNMVQLSQRLNEQLSQLEATLASDPTGVGDLSGLRTSLMDQYRHIRSGGDPAPDALRATQIKAMPQYAQVVAEFAPLSQRLAVLEKQYTSCVFGYQGPDGTIQPPNLSWTDEQWQQIEAAALHQTPRCWLTADPTQYAA